MNGHLITNPPIAIDFWNLRLCSNVQHFFLTHVHWDHIRGLNSGWKKPIYCSAMTKKLLIDKLKIDEEWVHGLDLNIRKDFIIDPKTKETMTVTLVDANHCPGSVMFHFEGSFGQILYTGDFKYSDDLYRNLSRAVPHLDVDHLYFDNTNWNRDNLSSREEAIEEIINIIENHPGHRILIGLYHVGKEYLLESISNELGTPISVSQKRHRLLELMGFKGKVVTGDYSDIRVVNRWVIKKELELSVKERPSIAIIPSGYVQKDESENPNTFTVPLSDHSSHDELCDFVNIIKPKCTTGITNYSDGLCSKSNVSNRQKFISRALKPFRVLKRFLNKRRLPKSAIDYEDEECSRRKKECQHKTCPRKKRKSETKIERISCSRCQIRFPAEGLKYNRNKDRLYGTLCSKCDVALSQKLEILKREESKKHGNY